MLPSHPALTHYLVLLLPLPPSLHSSPLPPPQAYPGQNPMNPMMGMPSGSQPYPPMGGAGGPQQPYPPMGGAGAPGPYPPAGPGGYPPMGAHQPYPQAGMAPMAGAQMMAMSGMAMGMSMAAGGVGMTMMNPTMPGMTMMVPAVSAMFATDTIDAFRKLPAALIKQEAQYLEEVTGEWQGEGQGREGRGAG